MPVHNKLTLTTISTFVALSVFFTVPVPSSAQGAPSVSVVTLQVVPNPNGGESVVTPKGMVVPLPGAGVNSNVVQVYIGSNGGYWYVDRNGQTVDLTAGVMRLQGSASQAATVPQYAPVPPAYSQSSSSSSSSGSGSGGAASTMVTATAAGLGAMAGAAMTQPNYYRNVPYGTPVYYPHGSTPYYRNTSGNTVNVEHNTDVNANSYDYHANNLQAQQNYYSNQHTQNTAQYKSWQQNNVNGNPFVRQDGTAQGAAQGGAAAQAGGAAAQEGENSGRFGRRGGNADDGGAGGADGSSQRQGFRGRRGQGDGGASNGFAGGDGAGAGALQGGNNADGGGGRFGRNRGGAGFGAGADGGGRRRRGR
jgi:hypothetical protein